MGATGVGAGVRQLVTWSTGIALFCCLLLAQMDWALEHGRSYDRGFLSFPLFALFGFYAALVCVLCIGVLAHLLFRAVLHCHGASSTRTDYSDAGPREWISIGRLSGLLDPCNLSWIVCGTVFAALIGFGAASMEAEVVGYQAPRGKDTWRVAVQAWPACLLVCGVEWLTWMRHRDGILRRWLWLASLMVVLACGAASLFTEASPDEFVYRHVRNVIEIGFAYVIVRYATFAFLDLGVAVGAAFRERPWQRGR